MSGFYKKIEISILVVFCSCFSCFAGDLWTEDFEAAKVKATAEGKDLLINFTGSDWCGWCIKLHDEVFSKPDFKESAPKDFVLVTIDFPRRTEQPEEIKERNGNLAADYGVTGYPTILLTDPRGVAYGRTGYQPGGPVAYLKHLEELKKSGTELIQLNSAIAGADGIEKAKLLDRLVEIKESMRLPVEASIYSDIIALDKDGKAGLKTKYEGELATQQAMNAVNAAIRKSDHEAVGSIVDKAVANDNIDAKSKQMLVIQKAGSYMQRKMYDEAIANLKTAQSLAPDSQMAKRIPMFIKQTETARDNAK